MNGLQSLASTALNLFREFVPGNPDAARFWLETGSGTLSLLPALPPTVMGMVDTLSGWVAAKFAHTAWPARTVLLCAGLGASLLFLVAPLTRMTFKVPGFLALVAWLAALATAWTIPAAIRTSLSTKTEIPSPPARDA